ncbi:hypothetical protein DSO57_1020309 [Entomophthora muscae]|uniref:Uncharacterized protein n=1 Tax=Entomophthora muscae TaxID=34485 RepID=A0ACC2TRD5_9FUNG|nr:hypothetical protein DSO57_1020309 [Entomophthora muscae]
MFEVLYINLTGLVDSVVPNSGPWSLLSQSLSYIIKLAPILWWALPASLTAPHPKPPNASTYEWLPDTLLVTLCVRNDNLDAPKSQNTEPESNPGQNPLQTARLMIATSPPVQDAENSPEVQPPDTGGFPGEIDKSPSGNYSKLSQSPEEGTEPKEAPNIQINKQKDLKSSHPKATSGRPPVPSATLPSETPNANPPKSRNPDQEVKPGSEG